MRVEVAEPWDNYVFHFGRSLLGLVYLIFFIGTSIPVKLLGINRHAFYYSLRPDLHDVVEILQKNPSRISDTIRNPPTASIFSRSSHGFFNFVPM
jgi:hypothetical protein